MTCKDCISYDICAYNAYVQAEYSGRAVETYITIDNKLPCRFFKDKSRYIELPCKVGQTVYTLLKKPDKEYGYKSGVNEIIVRHIRIRTDGIFVSDFWGFIDWRFGERAFLSREEAEKALAERSSNGKNN